MALVKLAQSDGLAPIGELMRPITKSTVQAKNRTASPATIQKRQPVRDFFGGGDG